MLSNEEKKEYEELKSLLYTGTISQYGKRKLIDIFETGQKELEELKDKYSDEKIRNTVIKRYREVIEKDYTSKDKIKESFARDIAFKKHLDRRGERIDQYNKGRFDVIEGILELLEE